MISLVFGMKGEIMNTIIINGSPRKNWNVSVFRQCLIILIPACLTVRWI